MDFAELKELFHWYVPEYDYKSPLSEMDKWSIIVNVSLIVSLLVGLLLFGLFCKLKHKWLVNAKCAFCNCVVRVWRAKLYWWFCNHCQRVNGYPKNSLVHTDSSSTEEVEESKDDSFTVNVMAVHNNKVQSPTNKHKRISISKNNLSDVSTIISRSPKILNVKGNDLVIHVQSILQDESSSQTKTDLKKIKNKGKKMFEDNDVQTNSTHTEDNNWFAHLKNKPDERSDLTKMLSKLILDDANRRVELLNAEKVLYEKMKQMKQLEKSLHDIKKNTARDLSYLPNESFNKSSHSIRRRNTFFERTLDPPTTQDPNILNKEINSKKDAAKARLATLEDQLNELQDMHTKEIALLMSEVKNKAKTVKKIEDLKSGVVEFYQEVQKDYDNFKIDEGIDKLIKNHKYSFAEKHNQTSSNDSDNSNLSESDALVHQLALNVDVKNEMSTILEENDDSGKTLSPRHIKESIKNFNRFKQDNKEPSDIEKEEEQDEEEEDGRSCESKRKSISVAKRNVGARIVKPIRAGQRPTATKVVLSSTPQ